MGGQVFKTSIHHNNIRISFGICFPPWSHTKPKPYAIIVYVQVIIPLLLSSILQENYLLANQYQQILSSKFEVVKGRPARKSAAQRADSYKWVYSRRRLNWPIECQQFSTKNFWVATFSMDIQIDPKHVMKSHQPLNVNWSVLCVVYCIPMIPASCATYNISISIARKPFNFPLWSTNSVKLF